jgi:hypothetical protein
VFNKKNYSRWGNVSEDPPRASPSPPFPKKIIKIKTCNNYNSWWPKL